MGTSADRVAGTAARDAVRVLGYSNPEVFFAGSFRYRTAKGFAGVLFGAAIAGVCLFICWRIMGPWATQSSMPARWAWAASVGLVAALMVALTAYAGWGWAVGLEVPVRVTQDGVEHGRHLWRWEQIGEVAGINAGRQCVLLVLTPGRGHLQFPRNLSTTPAMTGAEFAKLVERLTPYLAEHHPHVRLDPTPRSPS